VRSAHLTGMSNIPAEAFRRSPTRIAVLAAVFIAAVVVAVVFLANPLNRPQPAIRAAAVTTTTTPRTAPTVAPSPTAVPSAVPNAAPAAAPAASSVKFGCVATTFNNSKAPLSSLVDAVRTGAHTGYDRLTIEFQNGQPGSIALTPLSGTTFLRSPRGDHVTLAGRNGILVTLFSSDGHTAYSGPTDIKTSDSTLVEVREIQDFEGYVQYALGISGSACYHASILSNPTRLVVDVQTT
jgi:hypothetical protein